MLRAQQNWALWDKDVLHWLASTAISNNKYDLSADALDMRLALEPTLAALAAARADDSANTALQEAYACCSKQTTAKQKWFI